MPLETAVFDTEKGQVTTPKRNCMAAGMVPGSEVVFSLEGSKIVTTPVGSAVKGDRRAQLRAAAARVRDSFSEEFKPMGADEIMNFIRGDEPASSVARPGCRQLCPLRRYGRHPGRREGVGGLHRRGQSQSWLGHRTATGLQSVLCTTRQHRQLLLTADFSACPGALDALLDVYQVPWSTLLWQQRR